MRLLVDRNNDKILVKQVDVLRPASNACVSLLCCRHLLILFLVHRRQPFVEELAEDVRLDALVIGENLDVQVLQVKVDNHIVQIIVGAQADVVVGADSNSASTWRIDEQFAYLRFL